MDSPGELEKGRDGMKTPNYNRLPYVLAAAPFFGMAIDGSSKAQAFDWLRNTAELLDIAFFLGPILFYNWIGLISCNFLGGTPELWGSFWLAEAVYAATSSLVLFGAGKLVLKFLNRQ